MSNYIFEDEKLKNGTRADVEGKGKWKVTGGKRERKILKSYTGGINSGVLLYNQVWTRNNTISYTWKFVKWKTQVQSFTTIYLKNNNNIPTILILVLTRLNLSGEWCLVLCFSQIPESTWHFCFVIYVLLPSSFLEKGG